MIEQDVLGDWSSDIDAAMAGASLEDFVAAAERAKEHVLRSPLIPFPQQGNNRIRVKAENLQPLGSFKIRAALNILSGLSNEALRNGVATASAGNFAQGLTLASRLRGVHVTVHVPESAAANKIAAIAELGGSVVVHSFDEWWRILVGRETGRDDGIFIHPVSEPGVIIGNGTIGLELSEDWEELDTVVVPLGGGGLVTGIASALRAKGHRARIIACEIATAAPLTAARAAGGPVQVERRPSFVDGIGSTRVLDEMWPLLHRLVDDVIVVSVEEAEEAVRALATRNHLIVEGAGAVALAASMSESLRGKNVAAVLSGGNIDPAVFCEILQRSS